MRGSSLNSLILKLLTNGIRYRYLRTTGNPAKPHAVSIEITQRCIARCIMCNIWQSQEVVELSTEDWIEDLFLPKTASSFRKWIGRHPECQPCTGPGLERYALPFEGFTYLLLMRKIGKRDFFKLHHHMGLDKYFS